MHTQSIQGRERERERRERLKFRAGNQYSKQASSIKQAKPKLLYILYYYSYIGSQSHGWQIWWLPLKYCNQSCTRSVALKRERERGRREKPLCLSLTHSLNATRSRKGLTHYTVSLYYVYTLIISLIYSFNSFRHKSTYI